MIEVYCGQVVVWISHLQSRTCGARGNIAIVGAKWSDTIDEAREWA